MNKIVLSLALCAVAGWLSAAPLSVSGTSPSPVVVVVSGTQGTVRLLHEGTLVREQPAYGAYTAAVILAGPLDTVEWDGKAATVLPGGTDPVATARQSLDGRSAPSLFFIKTDGSVEFERQPAKAEGEDGESAATEE
jgi:hypothetical protein